MQQIIGLIMFLCGAAIILGGLVYLIGLKVTLIVLGITIGLTILLAGGMALMDD